MNFRYAAFASILTAIITSLVQATPSPARRERELLIGGNFENFVTIQLIAGSPASHYQSYRTMSLNTYESSTSKLLKLHHIEYISSEMDQDGKKWKDRRKKVDPVELTKVVRSMPGFSYAWTCSLDNHTSGRLFAAPEGIVAENSKGQISMVLPVETIEALAPWYLSGWRESIADHRVDPQSQPMKIAPRYETSVTQEQASLTYTPPVQTDASKHRPPCDSCLFWGDPEHKLKPLTNDTSPANIKAAKRMREGCLHGKHPQLEAAYTCAGRMYVVISEAYPMDDDSNSRSVILSIPLNEN